MAFLYMFLLLPTVEIKQTDFTPVNFIADAASMNDAFGFVLSGHIVLISCMQYRLGIWGGMHLHPVFYTDLFQMEILAIK